MEMLLAVFIHFYVAFTLPIEYNAMNGTGQRTVIILCQNAL